MSPNAVRASAAITGPLHRSRRSAATASKSPVAGDREPGLDDVDAEPRELLGDLELLAARERDAGRLLAVAQGGVEDPVRQPGQPPASSSAHVGSASLTRAPSRCGLAATASSRAARAPTSSIGTSAPAGAVGLNFGKPAVGLGDPLLRERAVLDLAQDAAHLLAASRRRRRAARACSRRTRPCPRSSSACSSGRPRTSGRRSASARAGTRSTRSPAGSRPRPASRTRLDQRGTPPHSTACSPNRSVSVSSLNVVSITPARAPPMPLRVGERALVRLARRVLVHGDERGHRRCPRVGRGARGGPGPSARSSPTSTSGGRRRSAEVDVEAVREHQHVAGLEVRRDVLLVDRACDVSGSRIMITSASRDGVGRVETRRPGLLGLRPATWSPSCRPDQHVVARVLAGSARARGPGCRSRGSRSSVPPGRGRRPSS